MTDPKRHTFHGTGIGFQSERLVDAYLLTIKTGRPGETPIDMTISPGHALKAVQSLIAGYRIFTFVDLKPPHRTLAVQLDDTSAAALASALRAALNEPQPDIHAALGLPDTPGDPT